MTGSAYARRRSIILPHAGAVGGYGGVEHSEVGSRTIEARRAIGTGHTGRVAQQARLTVSTSIIPTSLTVAHIHRQVHYAILRGVACVAAGAIAAT